VRRRTSAPIRLAALLLLAGLIPARPGAAATYRIVHAGKTAELEAVHEGRDVYLDVDDVADLFGFRVERDGRRDLALRSHQGVVRLRVGRALVTTDEQPILLSAEVVQRRGAVLVPVDFVTRAVSRLLGVEARHDPAARTIQMGQASPHVRCETFGDRTRVTLTMLRPPELADVVKDGRRRVLVVTNQELPAQVGGCVFDDTLQDLEIRPGAGQTRATFFVGPRFSSLEVLEMPDTHDLVLDFYNDASAAKLTLPSSVPADPHAVFDTVVIDPGHGGSDRGAVGPGGLVEKDLTLAVALELARLLRDEAGLHVVLTRDRDDEIGLSDRTVVANRSRADLFLSIHANATAAPNAWGAETYFLDLEGTDAASRTLAALENDATGLRAGGGGAGGDLELLLWDMAQQQYLRESSALAEAVQRELNELAGTRDRGVRQANFAVLRGATMPAVLVEVGFLSNKVEEAKMRGEPFRTATARALLSAVVAFRDARASRLRR
jgi:N-acetylmuramoyl-L-alanine amidase